MTLRQFVYLQLCTQFGRKFEQSFGPGLTEPRASPAIIDLRRNKVVNARRRGGTKVAGGGRLSRLTSFLVLRSVEGRGLFCRHLTQGYQGSTRRLTILQSSFDVQLERPPPVRPPHVWKLRKKNALMGKSSNSEASHP